MDPTTNLEEQLALAHDLLSRELKAWPAELQEAWAEQLAERVIALDEWLRRGGFLPRPWEEAQRAAQPKL